MRIEPAVKMRSSISKRGADKGVYGVVPYSHRISLEGGENEK